jgi:STE24 endopeptidase
MHWLTLTFLCALALQVVAQIWLAHRQISYVTAHRDAVPAAFADVVSGADHARAATYTAAGQRLGVVETVIGACLLLWLTLGGGIDLLGSWVNGLGLTALPTGVLHVLAVFAALAVAGLPLRALRTFRLEQRFGFNRTTVRTFILDLLKGWALAAVLGSALLAPILWIMASVGARWWLIAWVTWVTVSFILTLAWPRFIAPLFNRFSQLEDASLRQRIEALLARCGFAAERVFVVDGSRRSSHGNAYFTGLGRSKRVVFFDTLLSTLTHGQVEAVLAHELAHFKLGHVPQRLLVGALLSLVGFALLAWFAQQPWFQAALGVSRATDATALLLFVLVSPVFTWQAAPLAAAWSRHHEHEADAFAAQHSSARDLADALVCLYRDNASTLTPDPIYSAFHDSHPPPAVRVARLLSSGSASAANPVMAR